MYKKKYFDARAFLGREEMPWGLTRDLDTGSPFHRESAHDSLV